MFVSAAIVSRRGLRDCDDGKNNHNHRRFCELVKPTHKWSPRPANVIPLGQNAHVMSCVTRHYKGQRAN